MKGIFHFLSLAVLQISCVCHSQGAMTDVPQGQYLLPVGGPAEVVPEAHKQRNLQTAVSFLRSLGGPIPLNITIAMAQGKVPSLPTVVPDPTQARRNPTVCAEVSEDVKGQILPLGMYKNLLKTVEYFFIMPQTTAMRAAIVSGQSVFSLRTHKNPMLPVYASCKLEIPEAFADGNMVSFKINFNVGLLKNRTFSEPLSGEPAFTLTGKFYFDRQGKICGYDVVAPSFEAMWSNNDPLRQPGFPTQKALTEVPDSDFKRAYLPNPNVTSWLEEICDVATGFMCKPVTGTKFYKDKADCMAKLGKKRLGTYQDIDQDTLTCRALHRLLVPSRPEGHCIHLSSDLSEEEKGVCVDRDSSFYNKRDFQCGYDDVGYTNALAKNKAYVTKGYPHSMADLDEVQPMTVPMADM